jgi:hypothetical protein
MNTSVDTVSNFSSIQHNITNTTDKASMKEPQNMIFLNSKPYHLFNITVKKKELSWQNNGKF